MVIETRDRHLFGAVKMHAKDLEPGHKEELYRWSDQIIPTAIAFSAAGYDRILSLAETSNKAVLTVVSDDEVRVDFYDSTGANIQEPEYYSKDEINNRQLSKFLSVSASRDYTWRP